MTEPLSTRTNKALKFISTKLKTVKTTAEQALIEASKPRLPDQTGNAGKYLKTDGETASWEYGGGVGHHILEIFTTSRTDPAPINGAYDCNGAWYNKSDFTGENNPYDMLVAGKAKTCTNDDYEYELSQKGSCGKYVVDTANQRFRVPTINNILQPTVLASAIGEICDAGLPNITGSFYDYHYDNFNSSGVFSEKIENDNHGGSTGNTSRHVKVNFNASRSNPIYGNSTTVQPQTIKVRPMVQLATAGQEISIEQYEHQLSQYAQTAMINGRILGETIESLIPLTDAGIHLFDGSAIQKSGIYTKFTNYIEKLETTNPELFATQEEFDASVSAYGVCSKFVNGSSYIRLPKLYSETRYLVKSLCEGTEWYNLYSDGWCEQGGYHEYNPSAYGTDSVVFKIEFREGFMPLLALNAETTESNWTNTGTSIPARNIYSCLPASITNTGFNVAKQAGASWVAKGYAKETPDQEKIYRYICVATSVKTPVEVNIDNVITDLNNKADKEDLVNLTESSQFKEKITSMCSPDYSSIIETTLPYTAPCDGYIYLWWTDRSGMSIRINDIEVGNMQDVAGGDNSQSFMFALSKGDIFSTVGGSNGAFKWAKFVPMKGAN